MPQCGRCSGLILIEYLDAEPVLRCLACGARTYPPLPSTPIRTRCYYCDAIPAPGKVGCEACLEKARLYRKAHPKPRRKIGAVLPVVTEV